MVEISIQEKGLGRNLISIAQNLKPESIKTTKKSIGHSIDIGIRILENGTIWVESAGESTIGHDYNESGIRSSSIVSTVTMRYMPDTEPRLTITQEILGYLYNNVTIGPIMGRIPQPYLKFANRVYSDWKAVQMLPSKNPK